MLSPHTTSGQSEPSEPRATTIWESSRAEKDLVAGRTYDLPLPAIGHFLAACAPYSEPFSNIRLATETSEDFFERLCP